MNEEEPPQGSDGKPTHVDVHCPSLLDGAELPQRHSLPFERAK